MNSGTFTKWKQSLMPFKARVIYALIAVVAVTAVFWMVRHAEAEASRGPVSSLEPTVAVVRVDREDLYREVTIPAEFRPYQEVELHAKVSGFVDQMKVDFGDHVKAGQLLATLEVPELQDELHNAMATVQKAEADQTDAHLVYTRLQSVNQQQPNLVAQQDLDTAESKDRATTAALGAAKADVEKFQTLAAYTKITAPFDGVITWRYADLGSLIQAGTSSDTQAKPLVRISDNYRLRLDFPVSVDYVKDIHAGAQVDVRVESLDGRTFTGIVSRVTGKVNADTRTMIAEMDVPNPNLEIVPGMYATVVLKVEGRPQALSIPIEAAATGGKTTVYVVNANHEIEQRPVTFGLETPARYEVLSGLHEGDLVMIGKSAQMQPGQKVKSKLIASLAQE